MDENQNEETETYPKAAAYAQLFATALATGMFIGTGIVVGSELTYKAKEKIKNLRAARAAKKTIVKN